MPTIIINEKDRTVRSITGSLTNDNIVFIPGNTIKGPAEPTLCNSYNQFVNLYGKSPTGDSSNIMGSSWHYATTLLLLGMPVLFKRITTSSDGNETFITESTIDKTEDGVITTLPVGETPAVTEDNYKILSFTALEGGTYGDSLRVSIVHTPPVEGVYNVLVNVYEQLTSTTRKLLESTVLVEGLTGTLETDAVIIKARFVSDTIDTNYITIKKEWGSGTGVPLFTISETKTDDVYTYLALTGGADADEDDVKDTIATIYDEVADKYMYDVKFFTSGVYTDSNIIAAFSTQAEERGDAIALLDVPFATDPENVATYFNDINSSYCAAFAPWQKTRLLTNETKWMPGSFIFLYALARSLRSGGNLYSPPAGVNRGSVSDIVTPQYEIGSALLNAWQNDNLQCVNPIMRLRQYGYVIFGQSTLYWLVNGTTENRSALQDLSVRLTANEIKRAINNIALALTFEQNNLRTWNEFRGRLEPVLSNLLINKAINDYDIIIDATTTTNEDIDDNRIRGIVRVEMARAAEKFDIDLELSPSNISLNENVTL